jgi:myo-inositol-1(or 4)-monophosphatase
MTELNKLKDVAIEAAYAASVEIKKYIANGFEITMKGPANLVTEADLAAEKIIIETIKKTFPDHNFLGEEKAKAELSEPNLWIIDPIDGTTNFAHGVPNVGISIAFSNNSEVLVGCILNPFTDELYVAVKGHGSTLNSNKIIVSKAEKINQSLIATGFYYGLGLHLTTSLDVIKELINQECHGIRRLGAASIDLCFVACGKFDAYFELKLQPWDFAAGMLLVRESGGSVIKFGGKNLELTDQMLIASNGKIGPLIDDIALKLMK